MDLFDYLADERRFRSLIREGETEVRRRMAIQPEDANDIASEAIERLLDYYARKPERLFELETMEESKVTNYIKKALRNHIINIIKKRQRELLRNWEEIDTLPAPAPEEIPAAIADREMIQKELHFFIEEKYGREKWRMKKEAVDLYIERVSSRLKLSDLQDRYPGKKITVLNTEAHRIVKKYVSWAEKKGRPLAEAFANGGNL